MLPRPEGAGVRIKEIAGKYFMAGFVMRKKLRFLKF